MSVDGLEASPMKLTDMASPTGAEITARGRARVGHRTDRYASGGCSNHTRQSHLPNIKSLQSNGSFSAQVAVNCELSRHQSAQGVIMQVNTPPSRASAAGKTRSTQALLLDTPIDPSACPAIAPDPGCRSG